MSACLFSGNLGGTAGLPVPMGGLAGFSFSPVVLTLNTKGANTMKKKKMTFGRALGLFLVMTLGFVLGNFLAEFLQQFWEEWKKEDEEEV